MSLHFHEISESNHRILNPLSERRLTLIGEICGLSARRAHSTFCCRKPSCWRDGRRGTASRPWASTSRGLRRGRAPTGGRTAWRIGSRSSGGRGQLVSRRHQDLRHRVVHRCDLDRRRSRRDGRVARPRARPLGCSSSASATASTRPVPVGLPPAAESELAAVPRLVDVLDIAEAAGWELIEVVLADPDD